MGSLGQEIKAPANILEEETKVLKVWYPPIEQPPI